MAEYAFIEVPQTFVPAVDEWCPASLIGQVHSVYRPAACKSCVLGGAAWEQLVQQNEVAVLQYPQSQPLA